MPDPNPWTFTYNTSQSPEQQGFVREVYGNPASVVNLVTGGTPANRRIEITGTGPSSGVCWKISVPTLDSQVGVTAEAVMSSSGQGDTGFEVNFLNHVVNFDMYENKVQIRLQDDVNGETAEEIPTASNAGNVTIRFTVDASANFRLYRGTTLIYGPVAIGVAVRPEPKFLFWGEGIGTQIFRTFKIWTGGAMAPG